MYDLFNRGKNIYMYIYIHTYLHMYIFDTFDVCKLPLVNLISNYTRKEHEGTH